MLKELLNMRPYMVIKRRCVWNKTFLLGPIVWYNVISCFISPLFMMFIYRLYVKLPQKLVIEMLDFGTNADIKFWREKVVQRNSPTETKGKAPVSLSRMSSK